MIAAWPARRADMPGVRVTFARTLANHDGPVTAGTTGTINTTRSAWSFEVLTDPCPHCQLRRKVTYVDRSDVELAALKQSRTARS